jgi:hypothetical protein
MGPSMPGSSGEAHAPGAALPSPSPADATRRDPDVDSPHPGTAWRDPDTAVDRYLIPILLFTLAAAVYVWLNNGRVADLNYFVPLANAFLHGQLGLTDAPPWLNEVVPAAGGLSYVVYPPAPALLLMPIVAAFGPGVNQAWPSIAFGAFNVAIVSLVLRRMGVERRPRIILSLVFAFGTIVWYSAQAGSSWHFAQVAAMLFTLTAIWLCQRDGPPVLIGLAFAAAAMSRLPVAMAAPFFIAYFIDRDLRESTGDPTPFGWLGPDRPRAWRTRPDLVSSLRLAWPAGFMVGLVLLAYLVYNEARFGSPWENGYALIPGLLQEAQYANGFFSVVNVPRVLYAMLLTTPVQVPDFPWIQSRQLGGLSLLLTTPLFLWAIKARRLDWFGLGTWTSVLLILIPILAHADPGGAQFGFRYAQDLYPFLILLTVRGLGGRISTEAWIAIAIGGLVNLWGMGSTYYDWWA